MSSKRKIVMPTDAEDAEINRGIAADPDARELSAEEMRRTRPLRDTLAERVGATAADALLRRCGRPPADVTKKRSAYAVTATWLRRFAQPVTAGKLE
jgi:uncharacterized protein (DUF4415 family)